MDEDSPWWGRCKICGGRVAWNNRVGICQKTSACVRERGRLKRVAENASFPPPRPPDPTCKRPGCPKPRKALGYCAMHAARVRKTGDPGPVGLLSTPHTVHAGETFGLWTVLEDFKKGDRRVSCRCACGTERDVYMDGLRNGASTSCGCTSNGRPGPWRGPDNPYLHAGATFGRITLLEDAIRCSSLVRCRCECGTETERRASSVKNGKTSSCGCSRRKHGLSGHPLYQVWYGTWARTSNPENKSYPAYGGRGIRVCERWRGLPDGFLNFLADVGERPPGMSLDRIDNDGHYEPGNVQWSTPKQQGNNKRTVVALTREIAALKAQIRELTAPASAEPARSPRHPLPVQADALF